MRSITTMCSALLLGTLPASGAVAAEWVIEKISSNYLGTLGGANSFAHDVNDRGDIVGWSDSAAYGVEHAFVLRNGGDMEDLGAILGYIPTRAYGINEHGEVVGVLMKDSGQQLDPLQALYWTPDGTLQGMHKKPSNMHQWEWESAGPSGTWSFAHAINNSGGIGGTSCCKYTATPFAAWWSHAYGEPISIPVAGPGYSIPHQRGYDINAANHMVGSYSYTNSKAYLYRIGDTLSFPLSSASAAFGINDKDHVVGWYHKPSNEPNGMDKRAFFWNGATGDSEPLGVLPVGRESIAYEVNNLEFVAGWMDVDAAQANYYRKAAFIWHRDFGMIELPAPASTQGNLFEKTCEARSLNNRSRRGVIHVVGACTVLGTTRAVRWDVTVKPKQTI